MSFTTPLFTATDLVTYNGDVTVPFALSHTPTKIAFVAPLNSRVVYKLGVDYTFKNGQLLPTRTGAVAGLTATSRVIVGYYFAGAQPAKSYDYQIMHILSYGQSLSLGERAVNSFSNSDFSILTVSQAFASLMFNGGTRPLSKTSNTTTAYGSFVSLVEDNDQSNPTQLAVYNIGTPGETPLSGLFDWINTEAKLEGSPPTGHALLGSCPGRGGTSITGLNKTTAPYVRLLDEVTRAKALATSQGKSYGVPAVLWLQGEADSGNGSYETQLRQLFTDLNTDIKAISGQSKNVQFFMYQTAGLTDASYPQYNVQKNTANVHIAVPCYPFIKSDGTHLTAPSSRWMGQYFGRAIKRVCIDGESFACLQPTSWSFSGGNIILTLNTNAGLVLDSTGGIDSTQKYGFTLVNASATPVGINSVAVTSSNQLTIVPASAASAGFVLSYGGTAGGVRDNQGLLDVAGGLRSVQPLHNWLAAFRQTL